MNEKQEKIIEAIGKLNLDDKESWTNDGRPAVTAIINIVGDGFELSAEERDDSWESFMVRVKTEKILDAIAGLDPEDKSNWTMMGGKPEVKKLSEIVGEEVTKKERDAAWDFYQEQTKPAEPDSDGGKQDIGMYEVISPLRRNGKEYAVGDKVKLDRKTATQLIKGTVKRYKP